MTKPPSNDLTKRRWDKEPNPSKHKPETALEIAYGDLEEFKPDHVIVIFGKVEEDGSADWRYYQAGTMGIYAASGLAMKASREMC